MLWSAAGGTLVMLLVSLLLTALSGVMVYLGIVPPEWMIAGAFVITAVAVISGSIHCGKRSTRWKLPGCVISAMLYLLCICILRAVLFGMTPTKNWGIALCAAVASVAGAVISGIRKHR